MDIELVCSADVTTAVVILTYTPDRTSIFPPKSDKGEYTSTGDGDGEADKSESQERIHLSGESCPVNVSSCIRYSCRNLLTDIIHPDRERGVIVMRFKEMEKIIFDFACELSREITVSILEQADKEIMKSRDKSRYRMKQGIKTTIKALYGDVEYTRRCYKDNQASGYVFLLDEQMGIDRSEGLYSDNMKELVANACMNLSYGKAAEHLSEMLGRYISKTACWDIVQELGRKIDEKEDALVKQKEVNQNGKIVNVLFEETDGVWLKTQLSNKKKGKSLETKVVTIYEGWDKEQPDRLIGKTVIGGVTRSKSLKKKTEAVINSIYNIDEIKLRVINGDGASWISDMSDSEVVYQLDRFHIMEYLNRYIRDKKHRSKVKKLLQQKKVVEMIQYIEKLYNSVAGQDKKETEGVNKDSYLSEK